MAKPVSENSRKLKQLRERSNLSVRDVAKLVGWGHSRVQYYEDVFKKDFIPREIVELLASALVGRGDPPVTEAEVYALAGMPPPRSKAEEGNGRAMPHTRDSSIEGSFLDLPTNRIQSKDNPFREIEYVSTHPDAEWGDYEVDGELAAARAQRLLRVETDRMAPRYLPGETIILEHAAPRDGDHVWVEMRPPSGGVSKRTAMLRLLKEQTGTTLTLVHYSPKRTQTIVERRRILAVYRVLSFEDLLAKLGVGAVIE